MTIMMTLPDSTVPARQHIDLPRKRAQLFDLQARTAIVTGGNGGIGLGIARGLAQAGASV